MVDPLSFMKRFQTEATTIVRTTKTTHMIGIARATPIIACNRIIVFPLSDKIKKMALNSDKLTLLLQKLGDC